VARSLTMKREDETMPSVPKATNETIANARRMRDLAARSLLGVHRHEVLQALGIGKSRYVSALRHAVRSGWVRIDGGGVTARLVAIAISAGE
jgi:hypothetical protein